MPRELFILIPTKLCSKTNTHETMYGMPLWGDMIFCGMGLELGGVSTSTYRRVVGAPLATSGMRVDGLSMSSLPLAFASL